MRSTSLMQANISFGGTSVRPALVVNSADGLKWDEEADIVVVGFGGAGVSAALEARERGASVIAVDRFGGGGATAYSGGVFYAGDTFIQHKAGVIDSAVEMEKYLACEYPPVR